MGKGTVSDLLDFGKRIHKGIVTFIKHYYLLQKLLLLHQNCVKLCFNGKPVLKIVLVNYLKVIGTRLLQLSIYRSFTFLRSVIKT